MRATKASLDPAVWTARAAADSLLEASSIPSTSSPNGIRAPEDMAIMPSALEAIRSASSGMVTVSEKLISPRSEASHSSR